MRNPYHGPTRLQLGVFVRLLDQRQDIHRFSWLLLLLTMVSGVFADGYLAHRIRQVPRALQSGGSARTQPPHVGRPLGSKCGPRLLGAAAPDERRGRRPLPASGGPMQPKAHAGTAAKARQHRSPVRFIAPALR
ncbi:hypothetical protein NDU88_003468 [Pleurodeles waltl]|uniref:Uncharacterized protein n=1 Tax=Pleurodeles waltl TaxID=8319 RepID=A0AAV7VHE9_PLEWA|nr:hypothetical protein NDU88_003468 [Pleurodeles waltl]